jgi:hypothetical protein
MRGLVKDYLDLGLSRRGFLKAMAGAGFTMAAAESVLQNLVPVAHAQTAGKEYVKMFEGNGGELLAEQLLQTGTEYLFVAPGSGLGALCDAVVDRPKLKLVLATHEAHAVAMASGYTGAFYRQYIQRDEGPLADCGRCRSRGHDRRRPGWARLGGHARAHETVHEMALDC